MPEWTDEETKIAEQLIKRHAKNDEFLATIGRSKTVAKQRLDRVRYHTGVENRSSLMKVPDHVLEDRNRRLMARKSLTAAICGDPEDCRQRL